MFDARSILDILLGSGPRPQGRSRDTTVFKDMLDQLGGQAGPSGVQESSPQPAPGGHWTEQRYPQAPEGGQPSSQAPTSGPSAPGGGISLEDLLRGILGQLQRGQAPAQGRPPTGGPQAPPAGQSGEQTGPAEVSQELQDLLRRILQGGQGGASGGATRIPVNRLAGEAGAGGGETQGETQGETLAEALKQLLSQATAGAREGAARIDDAAGLSDQAREAVGQATGQTPEELLAQLKDLINRNQLAAGAALGGLGALVLGTGAGRSLAAAAARLGGLALIGGLAYKAYQNYQQGKPPLAAQKEAEPQALMPAPDGSGFEPRAVTHDAARRYIRAMIAAAAADGRIDAQEQHKILDGLRQAGLDDSAQQFLAAEIASPATVGELASAISSPEEALQVYTAARIAIDIDTGTEHAFLSALAKALGIAPDLAAQVDAEVGAGTGTGPSGSGPS